jgi:integrase
VRRETLAFAAAEDGVGHHRSAAAHCAQSVRICRSRRGRRGAIDKASEPPHFNAWTQRKAELESKLLKDMPHWQLHDLRRTARSLMSRAGVRPDIAERVLGHAIASTTGISMMRKKPLPWRRWPE